jgi:acyl-CoA dehydrogenase
LSRINSRSHMTDFEFLEPDLLSDELRMVRGQVRRFVKERIVPYADAWEEKGEIPRELFRDFGELGFLGMRHPVEYGGGGMGALASVVLGEELARSGYGGVASALTVHSDMSVGHIAHRGTHEQKQKYLPAACAGTRIGAVCVTEPGRRVRRGRPAHACGAWRRAPTRRPRAAAASRCSSSTRATRA